VNALSARFAVLVSGAAILVVETLATRLVGLTLESTSAVIGVALVGIAAGASLGGRWSDVLPPRRVAAGALVVGGLGVLSIRPLVRSGRHRCARRAGGGARGTGLGAHRRPRTGRPVAVVSTVRSGATEREVAPWPAGTT
jgi:hypothetical protein